MYLNDTYNGCVTNTTVIESNKLLASMGQVAASTNNDASVNSPQATHRVA